MKFFCHNMELSFEIVNGLPPLLTTVYDLSSRGILCMYQYQAQSKEFQGKTFPEGSYTSASTLSQQMYFSET